MNITSRQQWKGQPLKRTGTAAGRGVHTRKWTSHFHAREIMSTTPTTTQSLGWKILYANSEIIIYHAELWNIKYQN